MDSTCFIADKTQHYNLYKSREKTRKDPVKKSERKTTKLREKRTHEAKSIKKQT